MPGVSQTRWALEQVNELRPGRYSRSEAESWQFGGLCHRYVLSPTGPLDQGLPGSSSISSYLRATGRERGAGRAGRSFDVVKHLAAYLWASPEIS